MYIATSRLRLRQYVSSDVDPLLEYYSREDVCQFLPHGPWNRQRAVEAVGGRMHATGLGGADGTLSLVVEHERTVIGDVAVWAADATGKRVEVGWIFNPRFGARGFATEAVSAVVDACFVGYGVNRVFARMDSRNSASVALAARLGMRREADLREDWWDENDGWLTTIVFGMLASDRKPENTAG